jgi:PPOX class probable F420-dependent enzyme
MIFDPTTAAGAHARERLGSAKIGWLTTVTPAGQPQSAPVWFLWVEDEILVYSDRRARRNRNLEANPKVSFHLSDDGSGGDIVALEGEARFDHDCPQLSDSPAYLERYRAWIVESFGSPEKMAETYSLAIRITPTRGVPSAG